ncbi:ABC transporter [Suillus plorans]|uniref:ABC transporter n=1 Tax=Suillus plorans TaxID=116603 RepID=A0A9P7E3G7_9AGAM|nr:ABC transporter [Suillus plorans]KAG1809927.1 ABC transporter [Suillus plorans]
MSAVTADEKLSPQDPAGQKDVEHRPRTELNSNSYLRGTEFILVFSALLLSIFLVSLDQTIVATALPRIVSVFDSLDLATWVAAAYFLTEAGLMLCVGQLVATLPIKPVYLASIFLFEVGSLLCGAAPSMKVLIFGRAVAGCGAAGITICSIATIASFTRLEDRPVLFGLFGGIIAISSIVGPLLGGAFTDRVSWRWCFYINLPFGVLSAAAMFFWLPHRAPFRSLSGHSLLSRLNLTLDWIGTALCVAFSTCLLLGLEWGGSVHPWNSVAVIVPLCIFGVLAVLFIMWEWRRDLHALVPFQYFKRRTQTGACLEGFFLLTSLIVSVYYLPMWYQINGRSSVQSGIDILPLMLSYVVSSAFGSGVTSKTGHYWYLMFALPLASIAGAALLFTVEATTASPKLFGYQILLGVSTSGSYQSTFVSVQAEWADRPQEVSRASAILTFLSYFGAIIGLSIAGTVFDNGLNTQLSRVVGLSPEVISAVKQSVTVIDSLPSNIRQEVMNAAALGLRPVFLIPLVCAALASVSSLMIRDYNIRERAMLTESLN